MHRELFSGAFTPAKGNVLLVGNAAGLVKPVTGEGIGMAIKSGLLAADAIIKAADTGKEAKFFYLESLRDIIATLEKMYPPPGKLREEASKGGEYLLEAYRKVYAKSFGIL
jgi:flavin-dependent dehydrogenase